MDHDAWIVDEPSAIRVVSKVMARAARRWRLVLGITVLGTAGFLLVRASRKPTYLASMFFRLAEGNIDAPVQALRPPRNIRDHITNVALSRRRLQEIMQRHGWSVAKLALNPAEEVEDLRDDIGVEVSRNYFLYDRGSGDEPRSAQVTLSLRGSDPEATRAVLHEIGAVLEEQTQRRSDRLTQGSELVDREVSAAKARVDALLEQINRLKVEPQADRRRAVIPTLAARATEHKSAVEHLLFLEQVRGRLAFSATAERANLGLKFELYDESLVAILPRLTNRQLARAGAAVFVIVLTLALTVVGAFDDRVYGLDDLDLHGLPAFGAIGRFQGDDGGSYRARVATRGGVS